MIIKRLLACAAVMQLVAGCAAMSHMAGKGIVSSETSGFDGREVVTVSPNYVLGAKGGFDPSMEVRFGARWESTAPDWVQVFITKTTADIVVRGDSLNINVNGAVATFRPEASDAFVLPLDYLGSMISAQTCKLQLLRGGAVSEGDFARDSNSGDPTAKASFREFYSVVVTKRAALRGK